MSKDVKGERALLNMPGHHSTAAIVAEVLPSTTGNQPTVIFQLSDCDRSLSLDFTFYGSDRTEDWKNNMHKVDTLHDVISSFRKAMKAEHRKFLRKQAKDAAE